MKTEVYVRFRASVHEFSKFRRIEKQSRLMQPLFDIQWQIQLRVIDKRQREQDENDITKEMNHTLRILFLFFDHITFITIIKIIIINGWQNQNSWIWSAKQWPHSIDADINSAYYIYPACMALASFYFMWLCFN